ncbi:MAG: DUF2059 domain-containing protein [Tranquillimonas sp.]
MRRLLLSLLFAGLAPVAAAAAEREEVDALYRALALDQVIEVMRDEGRDYGDDLREEMFPGSGGEAWSDIVDGLYDAERMGRVVAAGLVAALADTDVTPLLEFFTSEEGARIVRLEIEARRALLDPDVEEAAQAALRRMRQDGDARLDRLDTFVEVNDLIELNVVGAMNSNYAFYSGMIDGNAFGGEMTEAEALSNVWSQEPEIRADTIDWLYSYLAMAYQPLDDGEIDAYTALSATPEGQAMNQAVFESFDRMYTQISRALGRAAADFVAGQDI